VKTWFYQNYQWIFSGVGVVIAAFIIRRLFSRREPEHETRMVATQAFHAENIHIGNAVVTPPAPVQPLRIERTRPNFVYAGAKRKNIFVSPRQREGICDPSTEDEREKSIHSLVLKFENRVARGGGKIERALNVIAKLKFRHKNGATERDIDYGIWLNSPCNSTDMGVGDTRELVLLCELDETLVTFEDKRIDNRDFSSEGFSYFEYADIKDYNRVDITLIDQTTQASVRVRLKFWREGGNFCTSEV
jgi:hypothetical protein